LIGFFLSGVQKQTDSLRYNPGCCLGKAGVIIVTFSLNGLPLDRMNSQVEVLFREGLIKLITGTDGSLVKDSIKYQLEEL
jgi:hypothetical protein